MTAREVVSTKSFPAVMKERPVLFSAPMVRALLDGSKTQTRRVVKQPRSRDSFVLVGLDDDTWWPYQSDDGESIVCDDGCEHPYASPYGAPGDRLWVRETHFAYGRWETRYSEKKKRDEWHFVDMTLECGKTYLYAADLPRPQPLAGKRDGGVTPKWWKRPAIFMPRAASRVDLEVTGVRVECLQDISAADCFAEGIQLRVETPAKTQYARLWEQINGAASWAANPWVWVVEFRRIRP